MRRAFALFMTTHGARKKNKKLEKKPRFGHIMFLYSVGVVGGYAVAKFLTPRMPRLKFSRFHLHHWIWASCLLLAAYYADAPDVVYGGLTGGAIQGLTYKNWSIIRES